MPYQWAPLALDKDPLFPLLERWILSKFIMSRTMEANPWYERNQNCGSAPPAPESGIKTGTIHFFQCHYLHLKKYRKKITCVPDYLSNHPRALKSLLTAFGLRIVASSPCTWRTSKSRWSTDFPTISRASHLLHRGTPPQVRWTRSLFCLSCQAKTGLHSLPFFWSTAFSLAGGGYTMLWIWISFWFLLLSQEGQSTVQLVYLHPRVSPWYFLIFLSHLLENTLGHSLSYAALQSARQTAN